MGTSFDSLNQLPRPLGPFTLIRLIAQGGMGQVFLALRPVENEPTDEVCVVKTVRTDLKDDREAVNRFLDEARVAQKLDHGSICHTLDAGVVDKNYYLALEFISGRNIRDIQTRAQKLNKKIPDAVIFHCLEQVLAALDYAHALNDVDTGKPLGIVHRDVSPHNLMLGFDGYVKLIDFGLAAHQLKRELTRPGIMVGKLRYNAPEQVRDRALDGRSDLYSVGVMLYELLVNERFYEGLSEEDIWRVAMKGIHEPRLYDRVPPDMKNVLDLALAPTPEERFNSAGDMRDAIVECARSRNLREVRRASAKFMLELFAEERQQEREMILQATGLAEARTRLFQTPMISDEPSMSVSSVGRTKIVSPAQLRGKLADLVSGVEFDPNAETQYGAEALRDVKEMARDANVFADEIDETLPANAGTVVERSHPRKPAPPADENLRADKRAGTSPSMKRARNTGEQKPVRNTGEHKPVRQTGEHKPVRNTGEHKPVRQTGEHKPVRDPQRDVNTSPTRKRRSTEGGGHPTTSPSMPRVVQQPPPPRAPQPPATSPLVVVAGVLMAVIVLGVVAAVALPKVLDDKQKGRKTVTLVEPEKLEEPDKTPPDKTPPDQAVPPDNDTGHDNNVVVNGSDTNHVEINNPPPHVDNNASGTGGNTGGNGGSVGKRDGKGDKIRKDDKQRLEDKRLEDKRAEDKRAEDKRAEDKRAEDKRAEDKRAEDKRAEEKKTEKPPPMTTLGTLKERVDYLKKYCTERVACAKSTTEEAEHIATLSPEDTKTLMAEIPKCIQRCQR